MFKVNNKNTRTTSMTLVWNMFKLKHMLKHQNDVNDVVLVFLLLTYFTPFSCVSIVDFEQVNVSWVGFEAAFYVLRTQEVEYQI